MTAAHRPATDKVNLREKFARLDDHILLLGPRGTVNTGGATSERTAQDERTSSL